MDQRIKHEQLKLLFAGLPSSLLERRPDHLERSAYLVLRRLRIEGPMSIGELSEAFGLDNSTVHRQTAAPPVQAAAAPTTPSPTGTPLALPRPEPQGKTEAPNVGVGISGGAPSAPTPLPWGRRWT